MLTPGRTTHACRRRPSGRRPRHSAPATPAQAPGSSMWGACGSGRRAASAATPASSRIPIASTPRCSSESATACCAAARGQPMRAWRARRSATGTCPSAARSSRAYAWRAICASVPAPDRLMEPTTPAEPVADAAIRIDSHLDAGERTLAEDVLDGLTRPFKELPPKHFYDSRGAELTDEYPGLRVHGVIGDLERHLDRVPPAEGPRVVAFLGGTIGNFPPGSRRRVLRKIASLLGPDDHLLLGTDLVKDPEILEAAYDDAEGVTAEFNRNLLQVLNRELGADFDPVALFDTEHEWVEMRLRARREHTTMVRDLDLPVHFEAGEEMRTEISAK